MKRNLAFRKVAPCRRRSLPRLRWSPRRRRYPSDLTDSQWALLAMLLARQKAPGGRPRTYPLRDVVNGLFYVLRGGISWRMMPSDLPPWETVYDHFRRWKKNGNLERVHAILRDAVRKQQGREGDPSLMIIDSQSAQTTEAGGVRGLDAGKKVKGRKRHIIVDTLGLIWAVVVHPADIQDAQGGRLVLLKLLNKAPRLKVILADQIYRGSLALIAKLLGGWKLEIVSREPGTKGFTVLPKRWVVERTFAWLGRNRRLSKDYERLTTTSEAWIHLAMIRLMLRRLRPN